MNEQMCKVHVIFDFTFIYYKYKFTFESGRLKTLGDYKNTMAYHCMKEVENIRSQICKATGCSEDVIMTTLCFDSRTDRKDEDSEYKANRTNKLTDEDYSNIAYIREAFDRIGYNVIKEEGFEADDLVYTAVSRTRCLSNRVVNVIVTIDKDLLSLVSGETCVYRYMTTKGYTLVTPANFEGYVSEKFKCDIPFNAMRYYLAVVGDKSDNIPGIKGFGTAAYSRIMRHVEIELGADVFKVGSYEDIVSSIVSNLTDIQREEFLNSLSLVNFRACENLSKVDKRDTISSRNEAYNELGFASLAVSK